MVTLRATLLTWWNVCVVICKMSVTCINYESSDFGFGRFKCVLMCCMVSGMFAVVRNGTALQLLRHMRCYHCHCFFSSLNSLTVFCEKCDVCFLIASRVSCFPLTCGRFPSRLSTTSTAILCNNLRGK